ncbi:MAG TPA: GNAT family N-acetyltransferase [Candidatus Eisenbacteria bacterium]
MAPITTPSLILRPFTPDDTPDMWRLSQEEAYRLWLSNQVYGDPAEMASVMSYLIAQYESPGDPRQGPFVFAIEYAPDRTLIGHVGFSRLDDEVEVGFSIGEAHQRRGLATEAVAAASSQVLRALGLERIIGVTAVANTASRRTLVRAGYSWERDREMNFQGVVQTVNVYVYRPLRVSHTPSDS